MPVAKNRRQTYLDQAKELALQGKLPGLANTGTMSFDEFLELPKPHQQRKIAKVLRDMHGLTNKKDVVNYLPTVGQKARSHTLHDEECITQEGVITGYSGNSLKPYLLENLTGNAAPIECSLQHLHGRLVKDNDLTGEEAALKDKLVLKLFEAEAPTPQEEKKHKRKRAKGQKVTTNKGMTLFHGGIVNVRRDEKNTIVSVLYQDLDKEDMDMKELLTLTAFKEDPNKLQRLDQLKINYMENAGTFSTSTIERARRALREKASTSKSRKTRRRSATPHQPRGINSAEPKSYNRKDWSDTGLFHMDETSVQTASRSPAPTVQSPGQQGGTRTGQG
jgi:hypothetical protein